MGKKLTNEEIMNNKTDSINRTIVKYGAYFRENPHRYIIEFLGIPLKKFQQILLFCMNKSDVFMYIASRGQGKTFLVALFAIFRCLMYAHTQCVVCSYTFKQGREIINKITDDFMHRSPMLRTEILKVTTGQNECFIYFKNGSWIKVVVAGEGARGTRSNLLIIDESRLVSQKTVDTILRPMNAAPRQVGFLNNPEYSNYKEMNKEIYMSSAFYAQSELFDKFKAYFANMLNPSLKYMVVDLPYQLSIAEGLLLKESILNEMMEATFSPISFSMEREGKFYGSSEDCIYDFNTLSKCRILEDSLHHLEYYKENNLRVPDKQPNELRILSVDVALMASRKHDNDASALIIHSAIPTSSHNYIDNIVYIDTQEGLVTEELGLLVMRYFYQYDCDYLAIDSNGLGISVADYLMADRYDPVYGQSYGALDCINDEDMSERCKVKGAPKVIWSIKANSRMNNDMILALRAGFQNGYINLLINDNNINEKLSKIRGYKGLSDTHKERLVMPYLQTTLLINELINLDHEVSSGLIKVREKHGMRKDRFSSLEYGYYVVQELSKNLKPKQYDDNFLDNFIIKSARRSSSM